MLTHRDIERDCEQLYIYDNLLDRIITDLDTVIQIIQIFDRPGIPRTRRLDTHIKTIKNIKKYRNEDHDQNLSNEDRIDNFIEFVYKTMTKSPIEKIESIISKGYLYLEKDPYNGITIINGKINYKHIQDKLDVHALFQEILASKVGIGLEKLKELTESGYITLDDLEQSYKTDKYFSDSLKRNLDKYFEGLLKTNKMTYNQATYFVNKVCNYVSDINNKYKDSVRFSKTLVSEAGSYARKKDLIGDIDVVIVNQNSSILVKVMSLLCEFFENDSDLKVIRFDERPKLDPERYQGIRVWLCHKMKDFDERPVKIEIYGYAINEYDLVFAKIARTIDVRSQRFLRYSATKKGLKLSEYGLYSRVTGAKYEPGSSIFNKIDKNYIEDLQDIHNLIDFKP